MGSAAREIVDEDGKKTITSTHRAGWDATISAPKSVSLAALVGGDERVREAYRESVNEAMKEFEKKRGRILCLEEGKNSTRLTTGNDPDREDKNETKNSDANELAYDL